MKQLEKNVIQWAKDRGIDHPSNAKNQLLKSFEEMGELSRGILKNDRELIIDSIGDVLVTLIILAQTQNLTLKECLDYAWNEIKDRKGKTVNGTFIKDDTTDESDVKKDNTIKILQKQTRNYLKIHGLKFNKLYSGEQYNPLPISYSTLCLFLSKGELSLKLQVLLSEFLGYEHQFTIKKIDKDGHN
jgi:NTP pyrophosphatase (non-canonical NTP hydrolase)